MLRVCHAIQARRSGDGAGRRLVDQILFCAAGLVQLGLRCRDLRRIDRKLGAPIAEQARGSLDIARFYEKHRRWEGAKIYYNEVLLKDPSSKFADIARERIDAIRKRESSN